VKSAIVVYETVVESLSRDGMTGRLGVTPLIADR
jgi:hypothetical protein